MSKGKPTSLITEISQHCHIYPGDTDVIRLSSHRLEQFLINRDTAILEEVKYIRAELAEQRPMLRALKKFTSKGESET